MSVMGLDAFPWVLAVVLAVVIVALVAANRLHALRSLVERHFPGKVVKEEDWTCRVLALPGLRCWVVPNSVTEAQVMCALKEIAKSYPGWVPAHRLRGRGSRACWLLEMRRPLRNPLAPNDVTVGDDPSRRVVIGLDMRRRPVALNATEHTLVVGLTGSGKGSVMAAYVSGLMPLYWQGLVEFWGIDLKGGVEMSVYGNVFDAHHAYTADKAVELLEELSKTCTERMDAIRGCTRTLNASKEYPRMVLIIDEAAELHVKTDRKQAEHITRLLDSLLRRGRAVGLVVVACICLMVCVPVCRGVVDRVAGEKLTM